MKHTTLTCGSCNKRCREFKGKMSLSGRIYAYMASSQSQGITIRSFTRSQLEMHCQSFADHTPEPSLISSEDQPVS